MSKSKSQVTGAVAHSLNPAGKRKRNWRLPGYYGWIPFECSGEAYYCYAYASIKPQQRSNSKTGYYNGYASSRPQQTSASKRGYYKEEGRSNSKDGKNKEGEKKNKDTDKDKLKNEEFPSLNVKVDQKDTNGSKQVNGKGVWENPPLWKGKEDLKTGPSSIRCHCGVHSYTKLVPKKPSLNEKIDQKDTNGSKQVNGKGVWENPPMRKCKEDLKTGHSSIKSNGGVHSYTKLVPKKSTPKTLGDKKSQFLKTLRTENASNQKDGEKTPPKKQDKAQENKPGESLLVNGIDDLEIERANDSSLLSISLEAEQRLLRLMGWNEADEEEYEITEDDIKEFQNRSKQVQQQRNGLVRTLPKIWSPAYFSVVGRYPETQ